MKNRDIDEKPENRTLYHIKKFLRFRVGNLYTIQLFKRKNQRIQQSANNRKMKQMIIIDRLYWELDSWNQISHQTDISREKKESENHQKFHWELNDAKQDLVAFHE